MHIKQEDSQTKTGIYIFLSTWVQQKQKGNTVMTYCQFQDDVANLLASSCTLTHPAFMEQH